MGRDFLIIDEEANRKGGRWLNLWEPGLSERAEGNKRAEPGVSWIRWGHFWVEFKRTVWAACGSWDHQWQTVVERVIALEEQFAETTAGRA